MKIMKQKVKRSAAWILSFLMLMTLFCLPVSAAPGGGQQSADPDLLTYFQVEPVTLVENTCGEIRSGDGPGKQWFWYSVLKRDPQFTIIYDGTEYTGTSWEIQYQLAEVTGEWLYLDESSSQCYQDQWKVNNTYQAEISLWGDSCIATCTVDVTIVPSLMTSLEVEDVVLYEGIHDTIGEWDPATGEDYQRYDIYAGQTFTIVYDGVEYSGTDSVIRSKLKEFIGYFPEFNVFDNQYTKDTVFKPGNEYPVDISTMGCSARFTATVKSNPITSLTVQDIELIEGVGGYYRSDGKGNAYFYYSPFHEDALQISVGTVEGTYSGSFNEVDQHVSDAIGFSPEWSWQLEIEQFYNSQWQVGETYKATLKYGGKTCDFNITILPNLLESIYVPDVEILEGTSCALDTNGGFGYWIPEDTEISVVYNGEKLTGNYDSLLSEIGDLIGTRTAPSDTFTLLQNEEAWEVEKTGTVKLYFAGKECEFQVRIVPNLVESISVPDIEIIEGTSGNLYSDGRFIYQIPYDTEVTVVYNGEEYKRNYNELGSLMEELTGTWMDPADNFWMLQNEEAWGPGDYGDVSLYFAGKKCVFQVQIVPSPMESISVENIEIMEGTSGYYDSDGRFIYQIPYDTEVTVVYNGEEYKRNYGELGSLMEELTGTWIRPSDNFWDLQYEEAWELENTYTAAMDLAGKKCEFQVQIVPSPMESISVPDIEIMEGTSGYYDPNRRFIYQIPYDTEVTVVYNGEEYKRNYGELGSLMEELTGIRTDPSDNFGNLQYEEAWELGDSGSVTMYLAGETCDFQVQIVSSPIEKISVPNIEIMEGISGYYESDGRFTYQIPYDTEVTVVYNGEEYKRNYGELGSLMEELIGIRTYPFDNFQDLQYEEAWKLGDSGSVTVFLAGKECKIQVKIVPSLVESISVPDITIEEGTSGSIYPDGRYYYEIPYDTEVTVVYNGEEYKRNYDEFGSLMEELTGTWIRPFDNFWVLQSEKLWEAGKTYEAQMKLGGQTCNFKVTIKSASDEPAESADYSAVKAALDKVPTDLSWYTLSSANALKAAIDAVDWDLTSEDQARVYEMAAAIENAIRHLIPINSGGGTSRANYSSVNSAVAKANVVDRSLYTEESLQALDAALAAIEKALPASQQSQVNKMAKDIEAAIAALVPIEEAEPSVQPADYSDVEAAISEVSALDLSLYTNDSVAALQNAIAAVAAGMTEGEQDSVDAMAAAIHSAIAGLVMKPADGWTQSDGNWYYNRDGEAIKGWLFDNGAWYLFDYTGRMVTGWALVGNLWYFLKSDGVMAANEWIDGYWLSESGAWIYNAIGSWKQNAVGWWYGDTSGWYAANEIMRIDNVFYMFDASGYWVP